MDVKQCAAHVRSGSIHFMCLVCNQIFVMLSVLASVLHISELLHGSLVGAYEEKGCVESVAVALFHVCWVLCTLTFCVFFSLLSLNITRGLQFSQTGVTFKE